MKRQGENVKKQKGGRGLQQTGRRADDREADEEDVSLGVRERAETVVIFLTGSIPETQVDGLAIDHHVRAVVVKHSRDVLAVLGEETHNSTGETKKKKNPPKISTSKGASDKPREGVGGEGDEETGLADRTITDNDTLDGLHGCNALHTQQRKDDDKKTVSQSTKGRQK